MFPAIAALAAHAWARVLDGTDATRGGWRASHVASCVAMAAVVPVSAAAAAWWLAADAGAAVSVAVPARTWVAMAACSLAWLAALAVALRADGRALGAMTAAHALTVAVALALVLPAVAPAFTARELARHYNREGRLPGRIWFYDERVGSFLYYLDAPLRAALTPERVEHRRPEVLLALRQAPPDTVVVIPVEQLGRLGRRIPLSGRPFVQAGHHRAYDAAEFVSALREAVDGR